MAERVKVLSPTKQEFMGVVYYKCGQYFQRKGSRLHTAVWKHFNGEIPKGCQVHHIDENKENNQIENLTLKTMFKHLSDHAKSRVEYNQKHIKEMQEQAKAWHTSEEGRAWHSQHAKKIMDAREYRTCVCQVCGKEFQTRDLKEAKFCSNNCKATARRRSGRDMEQRTCAYCGKPFTANKYAKTKCCSQDCAVKRRWGK